MHLLEIPYICEFIKCWVVIICFGLHENTEENIEEIEYYVICLLEIVNTIFKELS